MGMNISVSGLINAMDRQTVTASNIANINTPGYRALRADSVSDAAGGARMVGVSVSPASSNEEEAIAFLQTSNVDLASEQADTILNVNAAKANASAIRTENDTIGELLDLKA